MNGLGEFSRSPAIHRSGSKGWRIGKWTFRRIGKGFGGWNGIDGKEMEHGARDGTKMDWGLRLKALRLRGFVLFEFLTTIDTISPKIDEQKRFYLVCGRYIAKLLRNSITLASCRHKLEFLLIIFAENQ